MGLFTSRGSALQQDEIHVLYVLSSWKCYSVTGIICLLEVSQWVQPSDKEGIGYMRQYQKWRSLQASLEKAYGVGQQIDRKILRIRLVLKITKKRQASW